MNRVFKPLRNNYRTKILLSYLLIVALPLVCGLVYLYHNLVLADENHIKQSIDQRMDQEVSLINARIREIHRSAYLLSTNTTLGRFLSPNYYDVVDLIQKMNTEIMPMCSWFEASSTGIGDFLIFTNNAAIPESKIFQSLSRYESEPWMLDIMNGLTNQTYLWESAHEDHTILYHMANHEKVYTLYYRILLTNTNTKAFLAINLTPSMLFSQMNRTPLLSSGSILAFAQDGTALYGGSGFEKDDLSALYGAIQRQSSSEGVTLFHKQPYHFSTRSLDELNTVLISLVPQNELSTLNSRSKATFAWIVFATFALLTTLSYTVSTLLIKRIKTMLFAVRTIQHGNFGLCIPVKGNDEIDELALNINSMSAKIDTLINTVYKVEALQKETELRALQAQINPHFLFNTLETFKMMAEINDDERLADGITSLGNLLRYNISLSLTQAPLSEELSTLKDYIRIQNLLLNNHILLTLDIPSDCLSATVLRLLLQPLAENAIRHGYIAQRGNLSIHIQARLDAHQLLLTISDDGIGIAPEDMEKLRNHMCQSISNTQSSSIGLWNVNQRLVLTFGDSSALQFSKASPMGGFVVQLQIPQRKEGALNDSLPGAVG